MHTTGVFLTVEGGEGVGKTTFMQSLGDHLKDRYGLSVLRTREPGGSPLGDALRQLFIHPPQDRPLAPMTEFMLMAASRSQHVQERILPALSTGQWVICDRFIDSSLVYQGLVGGVDLALIHRVHEAILKHAIPNLTFLLDCDTELALSRVHQRASALDQHTNRLDLAEVSFHEAIRRGFLTVAKQAPHRVILLDASGNTHDILGQALVALGPWLPQTKAAAIHKPLHTTSDNDV